MFAGSNQSPRRKSFFIAVMQIRVCKAGSACVGDASEQRPTESQAIEVAETPRSSALTHRLLLVAPAERRGRGATNAKRASERRATDHECSVTTPGFHEWVRGDVDNQEPIASVVDGWDDYFSLIRPTSCLTRVERSSSDYLVRTDGAPLHPGGLPASWRPHPRLLKMLWERE